MLPRLYCAVSPRLRMLAAALPLLAGCVASSRSAGPAALEAHEAPLPALRAHEDHARAVAIAFHVVEFHATNGLTYRAEGASLDDALLQSASHDLGCPRDAVRSVAWVSPSRTSEHAYDGCGKRAVYRTAIYTGRSETQGREDVILAGLFAVPD